MKKMSLKNEAYLFNQAVGIVTKEYPKSIEKQAHAVGKVFSGLKFKAMKKR